MTSDFKEEINESSMIGACDALFDRSWFTFRNFYYRFDHEADLFAVSKARRGYEIEVKITLADWRADLKKRKHHTHEYLKGFYYAVPEALIDKEPEGIDPRYGLIAVRHSVNGGWLEAKIVRECKDLGGEKVPAGVLIRAFKSVYYRQWNLHREIRQLRASLKNRDDAANHMPVTTEPA